MNNCELYLTESFGFLGFISSVCFFLLTINVFSVSGQALEYAFSHLEDGLEHQFIERDRLIRSYFHQGLSYTEIVFTLLRIHGVSLCVRQLKRILARLGLKRRFNDNNSSPLETIVEAILKEIETTAGSALGTVRCGED